MNDCWSRVSHFCDIRERGRLFVAIKHMAKRWDDLCYYYLGVVEENGVRQLVERNWHFLSRFVRFEKNRLTLPNGDTTVCWSPWCHAGHLQLKYENECHVMFHRAVDEAHRKFLDWTSSLVQGRKSHSLLQPVSRSAVFQFGADNKVPIKGGSAYLEWPFRRVRVRLRVHRMPRPRVERQSVQLEIEQFEFV